MRGWLWPVLSTPMPVVKSRSSWPQAVRTLVPRPLVKVRLVRRPMPRASSLAEGGVAVAMMMLVDEMAASDEWVCVDKYLEYGMVVARVD